MSDKASETRERGEGADSVLGEGENKRYSKAGWEEREK